LPLLAHAVPGRPGRLRQIDVAADFSLGDDPVQSVAAVLRRARSPVQGCRDRSRRQGMSSVVPVVVYRELEALTMSQPVGGQHRMQVYERDVVRSCGLSRQPIERRGGGRRPRPRVP
jgi:hypothetical protein